MSWRPAITISLLVTAMPILSACDTAVTRFADEGSTLFNVAGVLRTDQNTQIVRIQPVRTTVEATETGAVNGSVLLTDVETGVTTEMIDSLTTLQDGGKAVLYVDRRPIEPGHEYRIDIKPNEGPASSATTLVPSRPAFSLSAPQGFGPTVTQPVLWSGMTRRPFEALVIYEIGLNDTSSTVEVEIPYTFRGDLIAAGLNVVVLLSDDLAIIRQQLGIPRDDDEVVFRGLRMQIGLTSREWASAPNGENIENGVGFFGSVAVFTERWLIGDDIVTRLGFVNGQ